MSSPTPPPNTAPSITSSQNMLAKLRWPLLIAFFLVVLFAIVPSILFAITAARNVGPLSATTTTTATVTPSGAQLQDLSNTAQEQLQQGNNLLVLDTSLATVMGVVLAIFAIVTFSLGAVGYFTNNGFKELEERILLKLADIETLQQKVTTTATEIEALRVTMTRQQVELKQETETINKRFDETNKALLFLFEGRQLLQQERQQEALVALSSAQRLRPEDAVFNYELGLLYSKIGTYEKAFLYLKQAIQADPQFALALKELGLAYRRQGDFYHKQTATTQLPRALLNQEVKEHYEHATEYLEKAIALQSDYTDALATLGGLYRRLGEYENDNIDRYRKALDYYSRARAADKNSSYALGNVASLSWYLAGTEETRLARARDFFRECQQIAKRRTESAKDLENIHWDYYDLALSQLVLGETEQGRNNYKEALNKTANAGDFESVLSNLFLLQKASTPITELDQVISDIQERLRQGAALGQHA